MNAVELPLTDKPWKIALIGDTFFLANESHHPYIIKVQPNGDIYLFPLDASMKAEKPMEIKRD